MLCLFLEIKMEGVRLPFVSKISTYTCLLKCRISHLCRTSQLFRFAYLFLHTLHTIHLAQLASCCLLWLSRQIRALLHIMLLYMIVRRQTWHACCLCQSINIFSKLLARRGQSVMATSSVPLQCIHVLMTKLWLTWAAEVVARQKRKGRAPVLPASSSRVLTRSTTGRY